MKIQKAIEILELRVASPFVKANPDSRDAFKLGIEALKRTLDARVSQTCLCNARLPGETPEEEVEHDKGTLQHST